MKRKDLKKLTGISWRALSDIFYERRFPEEKTLQKICNALGVRSSEVIEIVPDTPSKNENRTPETRPEGQSLSR